MTVYDVLGLCKFSRSLFWLEEDVLDAIEAVTGIRFTIEQLMAIVKEFTTCRDSSTYEKVLQERTIICHIALP